MSQIGRDEGDFAVERNIMGQPFSEMVLATRDDHGDTHVFTKYGVLAGSRYCHSRLMFSN